MLSLEQKKVITNMFTGNLTPKDNDTVKEMIFTGSFAQPNGFGSVLTARINTEGNLELSLTFTTDFGSSKETMWGIILNCEQRRALGNLALSYEPVHFEEIKKR